MSFERGMCAEGEGGCISTYKTQTTTFEGGGGETFCFMMETFIEIRK